MFQIAYNYDQDWREDEKLAIDIRVSQKIAVSPDQAAAQPTVFSPATWR